MKKAVSIISIFAFSALVPYSLSAQQTLQPSASPAQMTSAAASAAAAAASAATAASAAATAATANSPGKDDSRAKISGTPRMIRDNPVPQVFFSDLPDSYYIPESGEYNRIMEALSTGLQTKTAVSMVVDKKTRMIIDLDGAHVDHKMNIYEDTPEPAAKGKETPASKN